MIEKCVHLICKDHLVSGEKFQIETTSIEGVLKTVPVPDKTRIDHYYQSELYISHTDSKDNFIDSIYQKVKKFAIKSKYQTILKNKPDTKKLLDIGSGTGDFLKAAKHYNISSVGTEPNEQARKLSKEKGNIVVENLEDIREEKFDAITLWHVLEHVYEPSLYLDKINKLLDHNGILLIAVPNYNSFDAHYYRAHWAAYDVPRHIWHFSREGMKKILEKHNFKILKYQSLPFDSFYVSLLSEQYKNGRKNLMKAFFIGLRSNLKAIKTKEHSSILYIAKKITK